MPIPPESQLIGPLLLFLEGGKPRHIADYTNYLAELFSVSPEELEIRREKDQRNRLFSNKVQYARIYLTNRGLVQGAGRNYLAITPYGESVLKADPNDASDTGRLRKRLGDLHALPSGNTPAEALQADSYAEGIRRSRELRFFERNPSLAKDAKRAHGYKCTVCGFDFEARYGGLGRGFIECHYLNPLSERPEEEWTTEIRTHLSDVSVVCSNCHRTIHRRNPPVALNELKNLLITWP